MAELRGAEWFVVAADDCAGSHKELVDGPITSGYAALKWSDKNGFTSGRRRRPNDQQHLLQVHQRLTRGRLRPFQSG